MMVGHLVRIPPGTRELGEVTFFSVYDDVATAEAGQRALDSDPGCGATARLRGPVDPRLGNQGRFTRIA
jgi:hypothetical protein